MELGKQIKKYRMELDISQEDLAEKIYVSRQTISNWENNKNYPDVKSLLLLSATFNVTLDILIKGDLEIMKETIEKEEIKRFGNQSKVFSILFVLCVVLPVPLIKWLGAWGIGILIVIFAFTTYFAYRVEKQKKDFDIQTYKEIVSFNEGKRLPADEKLMEIGKRPYQKILLGLGSAIITTTVAIILLYILK